MFNKILVAIDRSTASRDVFETAVSLAKTTGASLMLLHILANELKQDPTLFVYSGIRYNVMSEPLLKAYEEQWQKFEEKRLEFLRSLVREAKTARVDADFTQFWGNPGRDICDLAQAWSADLILVGSRGLTGIKEMFLGSVSNYVTHHAPCSVFIVHKTGNTSLSVNYDSQSFQDKQGELTSFTSGKSTLRKREFVAKSISQLEKEPQSPAKS
ncbi:UspA domain-containing protein (plasmid) [Stanieria cyanosphaera PCC 7437]|uniref:UspA domain-containing protein n=1 Tax=Stanieria cyanosphaera (strain ATCC 29371 / PCC 7437) TaxID=111780 RepID=K9XZW7_STAC7|nr:universal stress protein [Stanieria cyanosphaera]AFZ38130.1 UspA domain-containing protein [Stanieria cyanosphaera PCC 7437]